MTPIVVFDGKPLPIKKATDDSRLRSRNSHLHKARILFREGNRAAAMTHYRQSVRITDEMTSKVIVMLQQHNIEFVVAPFEADAQLAFLSVIGYIDVVITEDSDAIAYGCSKILFKLDHSGRAKMYSKDSLSNNIDYLFLDWTDDMMRLMCSLAKNDYCTRHLRGIGIKTAHQYVSQCKSLESLIQFLRGKHIDADEEFVKEV